jgi:hypothetical protein
VLSLDIVTDFVNDAFMSFRGNEKECIFTFTEVSSLEYVLYKLGNFCPYNHPKYLEKLLAHSRQLIILVI